MKFVFGDVKFNLNKNIVQEICRVYGFGLYCGYILGLRSGLNKKFKMKNLSVYKFNIMVYMFKLYFPLIDVLKERKFRNINHLLDKTNKCYRGIRLKLNLPLRGQRTRTNAKSRKKKKII